MAFLSMKNFSVLTCYLACVCNYDFVCCTLALNVLKEEEEVCLGRSMSATRHKIRAYTLHRKPKGTLLKCICMCNQSATYFTNFITQHSPIPPESSLPETRQLFESAQNSYLFLVLEKRHCFPMFSPVARGWCWNRTRTRRIIVSQK